MKKAVKYFFRILLAVLIVLSVWGIWNRSLVSYGWMQLKGQLNIVWNSRPVGEVLNDPFVSDSVKRRLKFINEVRIFATDSLGLKDSKNYSTFYDQHSKALLWVLTACEPFELKAYHWSFPVLGEVSYKGYFIKERGIYEDSILKKKGYDTDFGEVSAWSTLGWFRDPILSGMLKRQDGLLAELIIHEMTHSTLYIKNDVNFNENLASAVGEAGAEKFLLHYYGPGSGQLKEYLLRKDDADLFSRQMLLAIEILDTLYQQIQSMDPGQKLKIKNQKIIEIVNSMDTLPFHYPQRYSGAFAKQLPNNAYFLNYVRYDAQKSEMREELRLKFNENIAAYLDAMRVRYQ